MSSAGDGRSGEGDEGPSPPSTEQWPEPTPDAEPAADSSTTAVHIKVDREETDPPTQRRGRPPSEPTEVLRSHPKPRRRRPSDPTEVLGPFPMLTTEPIPPTELLGGADDCPPAGDPVPLTQLLPTGLTSEREQGDACGGEQDRVDELDEPPPAAIRPLGQLGATVLTSRPNQRAAPLTPTVMLAEPDDGLGVIVDDDDTPEDELPPTLPPAFLETRSAKAKRSQAEKLEEWLGLRLDEQEGGPSTADLDSQKPPDTASFDVSLIEQRALPFGVDVQPSTERAPPQTQAPSTSPAPAQTAVDALPFEAPGAKHSDRLEQWLAGQFGEQPQAPTPCAAPFRGSAVRPPDPLRELAATPADAEPAQSEPEESQPSFEPVALSAYAQVRAAVWHGATPLVSVLERVGIDELRWRRNERYQEQRLRQEAAAGRSKLAREIHAALCTARAEHLAEVESLPAPLGLEAYAAVRVALESADEPEQLEVLARHGLTTKRWDVARSHWAGRTHGDRQLARRLRRALADARRSIGSTGG